MSKNKMEQVKNQKSEEQIMDYGEFMSEVTCRIQQYAGKGTEVGLKDMERNNGVFRKGIVIHEKNENIAPVIYLEPYYARYLEGAEMDGIVWEVYTAYFDSRHPEGLDVSLFLDYEKAKKRVLFKLVNCKLNGKLLKEVPHRNYLDLAVVFYCPLAIDEIPGTASVLVRNEHLALWGITEEELTERAYQNTPRLLGHQLLDMEDIIRDFLSDGKESELPNHKDKTPEMLILTNRDKTNGAACMLYPSILEKLAEERNSSFIILPSSIHEVILVPIPGGMEKGETEAYTQMVREVNQTELAEEEILSDHAYFYDRSKAEICTA